MIYSLNGILFNNQKKRTTAICNMNECYKHIEHKEGTKQNRNRNKRIRIRINTKMQPDRVKLPYVLYA